MSRPPKRCRQAQIEVDERFAAASRSWRSAASEPARSCGRIGKGNVLERLALASQANGLQLEAEAWPTPRGGTSGSGTLADSFWNRSLLD